MQGPSPYKLAAFGAEGSTDFFGDYRPDLHETLVVDDFYSNWKYTTFLQVCDRYPTEVHTKGGFRQLLVRHIVFTSNHSPSVWYPNVLADADRRESFNRRIHNIIWFTPDGYWVQKGHLPWECTFLQPLAWNHVLRNQILPLAALPQSQNLTIQERGNSHLHFFVWPYSFLRRNCETTKRVSERASRIKVTNSFPRN